MHIMKFFWIRDYNQMSNGSVASQLDEDVDECGGGWRCKHFSAFLSLH